MDGLSAAALADLAGTTVAEVQRLVDLGILVRDVAGPLRASDVQRVRPAHACEHAGLPLDGTLAELVGRTAREHGGLPVKWLGDGAMVYFREPAAAVRAALQMVERLPAAGLPAAHVGVAAGPVVAQGGDYFGRTVNLAARIPAHAGPGQVLVSERVAEVGPPAGMALVEAGEVQLKGFASPVRLLKASRR
jgi:class 3 adenylate cyclase